MPVVFAVALLVGGCSAHRSAPRTTVPPLPGPTTVQQLCDAQAWPRPLPDVIGRLLYQAKDGALGCWDGVRAVAPDGHDPLHSPAQPAEKTYRIVAISPAVGTPTGRHDTVTVDVAELDPSKPAAFRPCEWVSETEARGMLGGQVSLEPYGDQAGSVDMACIYNKPGDMGGGVEVDLQVPGAFLVDAASQFALDSRRGTVVEGVGVRAACLDDLTTSPPSTTLVVLLGGDRLLRVIRVIQGNGSCDTLKRFAQLAIGRIG